MPFSLLYSVFQRAHVNKQVWLAHEFQSTSGNSVPASPCPASLALPGGDRRGPFRGHPGSCLTSAHTRTSAFLFRLAPPRPPWAAHLACPRHGEWMPPWLGSCPCLLRERVLTYVITQGRPTPSSREPSLRLLLGWLAPAGTYLGDAGSARDCGCQVRAAFLLIGNARLGWQDGGAHKVFIKYALGVGESAPFLRRGH